MNFAFLLKVRIYEMVHQGTAGSGEHSVANESEEDEVGNQDLPTALRDEREDPRRQKRTRRQVPSASLGQYFLDRGDTEESQRREIHLVHLEAAKLERDTLELTKKKAEMELNMQQQILQTQLEKVQYERDLAKQQLENVQLLANF